VQHWVRTVSTPVFEKPEAPARVSITVAAISTPTMRVKVRWGANLAYRPTAKGWGCNQRSGVVEL